MNSIKKTATWLIGGALVIGASLFAYKTAQEFIKSYISKKIEESLWDNISRCFWQTFILVSFGVLSYLFDSFLVRLAASVCTLIIISYNVMRFLFHSAPELFEIKRKLDGLEGTILNFLQVSVISMFLELDVVFLLLIAVFTFILRSYSIHTIDIFGPLRVLTGA